VEVNMLAQHQCTDFGMEKNRPWGDGVITVREGGRTGGFPLRPGFHRREGLWDWSTARRSPPSSAWAGRPRPRSWASSTRQGEDPGRERGLLPHLRGKTWKPRGRAPDLGHHGKLPAGASIPGPHRFHFHGVDKLARCSSPGPW
jgi:hypothetical protein